jgi:hypothetical protein
MQNGELRRAAAPPQVGNGAMTPVGKNHKVFVPGPFVRHSPFAPDRDRDYEHGN